MKTIPIALASWGLLLSLGSGTAQDRPVFTPKAGSRLTKQFVMRAELDLDESTLKVDGVDQSELFGQVGLALRLEETTTVTDRYEEVQDGRVTRLRRTFDEVGGTTRVSGTHPVAGPKNDETEFTSDLVGASVVFAWNAGASGYEASYAEKEGDARLLEGLEEDLDLEGFLPTKEVAEGESWNVPPDVVRALIAPGGDLKLRAESAGQMGGPQASQSDLIGELDGKFVATFGGVRSEDGAHVAVIQLEIEARSSRDLGALAEELGQAMRSGLPDDAEMKITSLDAEYELDAEGELLWNLQSGLLHALSLSGQMRKIVVTAMTMKLGPTTSSMESSQIFSGTQSFSVTTKP